MTIYHVFFDKFLLQISFFFANNIKICYKTEVPTVILRCFSCLNPDWIKNYDVKHNFFHFRYGKLFYDSDVKKINLHIYFLCSSNIFFLITVVRNGKKSPNQETDFGSRGRLKVLNDTKLVLNEHE